MTDGRKGKSKSVKSTSSKSTQQDNESQRAYSPQNTNPTARTPPQVPPTNKVDLRKEYNRYCKLYSSEPLDIVAGPLEKASYRDDLVQLDLKGRGLRGVDCISLGKILSTNSTIYHLNLSDCLLLPQGFHSLLEGLAKNSHLCVLELRGNNIQSRMVESLSGFLKLNHTVKKLLLEWNCLGTNKSTFELFCNGLSINKGLEDVDLRNNQIPDASGIDIAAMLKQNNSLMSLDLRWNSLGIQSAKAIWDSLKYNRRISNIELCGNFVPEEIVRHVKNTLSQRVIKSDDDDEETLENQAFSNKSTTEEDEYKSEIQSLVSASEDEEAEFKRRIRLNQQKISSLEKELDEERVAKRSLQKEINKIQDNLQDSSEKTLNYKIELQIKSDHICKLEEALKSQTEELESNFGKNISKLVNALGSLKEEHHKLNESLQEACTKIKEKESQVSVLNDLIETHKENCKKSQDSFEERLCKEKEKWLNWKAEVESSEQDETKRLEVQLLDLQKGMKDHLKLLEIKQAETDGEINRLKILLITEKTKSEEKLSQLRNSLNEENLETIKGLLAQIARLKEASESLEAEAKRLDSLIRKLQSDNQVLQKEKDNLREQNTKLENEVEDAKEKGQESLFKSRNELKELSGMMSKEEEGNKMLRGQVLETQEQIAYLTMKLNRAEKQSKSEGEYWKAQILKRDEELKRLKTDDMRRASLLQDAFIIYMRSTSTATGLPVPPSTFSDSNNQNKNERDDSISYDFNAQGDNKLNKN